MIHDTKYNILSIDTSCDETSAAVTRGMSVLSNVIWSQASMHAKFGGVYPSLAKRAHEEHIDWVINKAIQNSKINIHNLDAIAVTVGPGLAIALEIGIKKAKEFAIKYKKPIIPINHVVGHLFSPLSRPKNFRINLINKELNFPSLGLVVSGGTTQLILIEKIGGYQILAQTHDDALGESLDKSARLLGLGYPGGAVLEKFARSGNPKTYPLPIPMLGRESEAYFSYSGLKTAFVRLVEKLKNGSELTKEQIYDLSASYQNIAFEHLIRVVSYTIKNLPYKVRYLFVGGGVGANIELRKRIRKTCRDLKIIPLFPYSQKLFGDNAAMIGVAAHLKLLRKEFVAGKGIEKIERIPRFSIETTL